MQAWMIIDAIAFVAVLFYFYTVVKGVAFAVMCDHVDIIYEPKDKWIGIFDDRAKKQVVYVFLVPTVGVRMSWLDAQFERQAEMRGAAYMLYRRDRMA